MTKPQIKEYDCLTNQEIVREATKEEIAQIELDAKNALLRKTEFEAKEAAKLALLDRLGITAEEANLLLA